MCPRKSLQQHFPRGRRTTGCCPLGHASGRGFRAGELNTESCLCAHFFAQGRSSALLAIWQGSSCCRPSSVLASSLRTYNTFLLGIRGEMGRLQAGV